MNFENLVFEGGGIRAIAFLGVLKYLHQINSIQNIKRVIGSSAGCLYAVSVACKVDYSTIENIIMSKDFSTLKDDNNWNYISDIIRIIYSYGLCKGDALFQWYSDILKQITGKENITFLELYEKTNIELVITGTNLNEMKTEYFSHKLSPTMELRLAMRISTSIPLYFKSIQLSNTVYVDGGFLNNYPISYFDKLSSNTLGLKLMASDESISDGTIKISHQSISNIKDYIEILIDSALNQIEKGHIKPDDWKRSVIINTGTINTTDFNININKINWLINQGYIAMSNFKN